MPLVGEPADQAAHVAHPARVEAGGGLVEQQQPRLAQQRRGDPEPLAHPVRVAADPVLGAVGQLDGLERLVDPRRRAAAVERGQQLEVARARSGTGRRRGASTKPATPSSARTLSCGSRPNSRTVPAVGRISPSIIRSEVVLPAPFGPR